MASAAPPMTLGNMREVGHGESQWVIFKVSSIEQFIPDCALSIHIADGPGVASP